MRYHQRNNDEDSKDKYLQLRQILNIVFMIGAVAGVLIYFYYGKSLGTIIILVAMFFKMVECVLRLLK